MENKVIARKRLLTWFLEVRILVSILFIYQSAFQKYHPCKVTITASVLFKNRSVYAVTLQSSAQLMHLLEPMLTQITDMWSHWLIMEMRHSMYGYSAVDSMTNFEYIYIYIMSNLFYFIMRNVSPFEWYSFTSCFEIPLKWHALFSLSFVESM